jgi:serine/threonine protein phosphatase PrpC
MINYTELLKISNGITTTEELYYELKSNFSYLSNLYEQADTELRTIDNIDYKLSGTTCNIIFKFNKHLVCANVGDSRGILIYDKGGNTNQGIIPLSQYHKPYLPGE